VNPHDNAPDGSPQPSEDASIPKISRFGDRRKAPKDPVAAPSVDDSGGADGGLDSVAELLDQEAIEAALTETGTPGEEPSGAVAGGAGADMYRDVPVDPEKPKILSDTQLPPEMMAEGGGQSCTLGPSSLSTNAMSPRHKLEAWLAEMVRLNASDLILRASGRPSCRIDGRIHFLPGRVPAAGPLYEVLEGIVGPDRVQTLRNTGSVDTAMMLDGLGRFRLNAYKQMGEPALVLRRVFGEAPKLSSLHLPTEHLERLALRRRGLILVTGIAGSGKSTALAAMIQYMNTASERHIITLEDPIEVMYSEDRCVISQREMGTDCENFAQGVHNALRQSPDAILIGEMRDAETVAAALDATETGHLVMSTLHTVNAPQSVDRILSFFPSERHSQVRQRLAENLAAVLSLRLMPRKSGTGMVPAVELLISTPRVRELLYEGKVTELSRVVEAGGEEGLMSFNQSLQTLIQQDLIDLDTALAASDRPEELLLALRGFSKGQKKTQVQSGDGGRLRLAGGE
jgi:twitching motility protein PilT